MKKVVRTVALSVCSAGILAGLLFAPQAVLEALRSGIGTCATVLIPSLFPFLVLSAFLINADVGGALAELFHKKSGGGLWFHVLVSVLGGYPVAARSFSGLSADGRVSRRSAVRLTCALTSAGPAFVLTAVGVGMRGSWQIGAVLLVTQWCAAATLGLVALRRNRAEPVSAAPAAPMPIAQALVSAVRSSALAMGVICAYVLVFAAIAALLEQAGLFRLINSLFPQAGGLIEAAVRGLLEITTGCVAAANVPGTASVILTAFLLGFGGLCVWAQVLTLSGGELKGYFLWRLAYGLLAACLTALALLFFPQTAVEAFAPAAAQAPVVTFRAAGGSALLVLLCVLLCVGRPASKGGGK